MQKPRLRPQGFTLMELFITVFVLVSLFTAFVSLFHALTNYSKRSYNLLAASDLAYSKLLAYEQKDFAAIAIGNSMAGYKTEDFSGDLSATIGEARTGAVYVTPIRDSQALKKIDVVVTYKEGRNERTVHYAAIVNARGDH